MQIYRNSLRCEVRDEAPHTVPATVLLKGELLHTHPPPPDIVPPGPAPLHAPPPPIAPSPPCSFHYPFVKI